MIYIYDMIFKCSKSKQLLVYKDEFCFSQYKTAYLRGGVSDTLHHSWLHRQLTGRRIVVSSEIVYVIVVIHGRIALRLRTKSSCVAL